MGRAVLVMANDGLRAKAKLWIDKAPQFSRVTFQGPKRTIPQNSRFWASLTDVATQVTWHGIKLSPDDWKLIFLDALNQELRIVPNLDGTGFVNLGRSSSALDVAEMSEALELMYAWGAQNGVTFHDDRSAPGGIPATQEEARMAEPEDDVIETTEVDEAEVDDAGDEDEGDESAED